MSEIGIDERTRPWTSAWAKAIDFVAYDVLRGPATTSSDEIVRWLSGQKNLRCVELCSVQRSDDSSIPIVRLIRLEAVRIRDDRSLTDVVEDTVRAVEDQDAVAPDLRFLLVAFGSESVAILRVAPRGKADPRG